MSRKTASRLKHRENIDRGLYERDTEKLFVAINQLMKSGQENVTAYEAEYAVGRHFFKNPSSHKGRFTELERCRKIKAVGRRMCQVRESICTAYVPTPRSQWIRDPGTECALVPRVKIGRLLKYLHKQNFIEASKLHAMFQEHM